MNNFLYDLKNENNFTLTENGALTHKTTNNKCLDFLALGAAMRYRDENDIIVLFFNAFCENKLNALKLLFYTRDIRDGQGERRIFKIILKQLSNTYPDIVIKNIDNVPKFGRYDDLLVLLDTICKEKIVNYIKKQLIEDLNSDKPSLLAKWLPSENTSSYKTRQLANKLRKELNISSKEYRKILSKLRKKINIVESLISKNKWQEIKYDKLPSKAGFKYRIAFRRHDEERYLEFISNNNKINAKVLYPYEIVNKMIYNNYITTDKDIDIYEKYWNNLKNYFNGKEYNNICVVDTSGSMLGRPIEVALSLGLYTAERAKGPYKNHFITFSNEPEIVEIYGDNIYEKLMCIKKSNWGFNTNIVKVFDLLLNTALRNNCNQEEIPQNIIIISDMEFDDCCSLYFKKNKETIFESISEEWQNYGYKLPHIIFWNVDARQRNIPVLGVGNISYVSGFSPSIFGYILSNKTGEELMMEIINNPKYDCIQI